MLHAGRGKGDGELKDGIANELIFFMSGENSAFPLFIVEGLILLTHVHVYTLFASTF